MSSRTCPKCREPFVQDAHDDWHCGECGFVPDPAEVFQEFEVEDAETFAAVDEPGADPLVVSEGGCVVPVGGFVLVYGSGGAGKTTTCIDWAVHFAAGASWLEILEPARPLRILLVENEGPRPEFRRKLRRRLDAWNELEGSLGQPLEGRLTVLTEPWAMLTLRDDWHREELARVLSDVDLIVVGPLSGLGMEGGGTLDEIRAFTSRMHEVRELAGHPVAFMLVHHENKAGSISGAWEGTADTTVHVQAQGHGKTRLYWQKVRWCSALHDTTTHLHWANGDSFAVEEREEITEATMVDEILARVRELGGWSWSKVRPQIRGNDADKATLRDRLISDGKLVNRAAREGHFNLWVADDPAMPRAELSTAPARASATSPQGEPETGRATVPYVSRHGAQHGTGGRGSDSDLTESLSALAGDLVACLVCGNPYSADEDHPLRCPACIRGGDEPTGAGADTPQASLGRISSQRGASEPEAGEALTSQPFREKNQSRHLQAREDGRGLEALGSDGSWLISCTSCPKTHVVSDLEMAVTGELVRKHRECYGLSPDSSFDTFGWRNGRR